MGGRFPSGFSVGKFRDATGILNLLVLSREEGNLSYIGIV